MAYDEALAARVREILAERGEVDERKMFGGIAFMVRGYMCCGVLNDDLVLRLGREGAAQAMKSANVRPMSFTGRTIRSFVFVEPQGARTPSMLRRRIRGALEYVESLPATVGR
jgi:TfoX/Sxy family transcriptional regulator of competence genes